MSGVFVATARNVFIGAQGIVRGKPIHFKLFGKPRTLWIWKRTYHLLERWESKQDTHYAYEFVARR